MKKLLLISFLIIKNTFSQGITIEYPQLNGTFMGQELPPVSGELFAPRFLSTGLEELVLTFTPDGKECFWSVMFTGYETILTSRLENGLWIKPELAPFAGRYYDGWPALHPNGKRLYFHSSRPKPPGCEMIRAAFSIWYVDKTDSGWSEPKILTGPVNEGGNATCPSLTAGNVIYFSKRFDDDTEKICCSRIADGEFGPIEILPASINSSKYNFHGVISPDEEFLIMPVYGRKDAIRGGWNYYTAFRNKDGVWGELINAGKEINSLNCEGGSSFSADGKYVFFQARKNIKINYDGGKKIPLNELLKNELEQPGEGSADIYIIPAQLIKNQRSQKSD